jgi:hypothetical protein
MTAPSVEDAFSAALAADAGASPPDYPAPPRHDPGDPDAPHGRGPDGTPLAPYGFIADGTRPRIKPAGPGRKGKADKASQPRVKDAVVVPAAGGGWVTKDYREDLAGLATTLWMAGCSVPPARPYAHLLKQTSPGMVEAWNKGAQQNPYVRGYVEKLAGDGSWAWVIGCAVTTAPFLMGCWDLARPVKDPARRAERDQTKADLAAAAKAEFEQFVKEQMSMISGAGLAQEREDWQRSVDTVDAMDAAGAGALIPNGLGPQ